MENRSSWSLINVNMCLTTSHHTLEFHQNLSSSPTLISYIYKKRESFYLVKLYNIQNPENSIEKEMKMLTQLNEKHSISLQVLEKVKFNDRHFLIYTLKDFLPLSSYLKQEKSIDKSNLIFSLINLIKEIHKKHLIHSCLNLDTIFINKDKNLKIIGFEDSLSQEDLNLEASELKKRLSMQHKLFKAPELVKPGFNISEAIDIWSLGCIIFKILYPSENLENFDDEKQTLIQYEKNSIYRKVFKLCFFIDPAIRGNLKGINEVLTSTPQKYSKISKFSKFFNESTNYLVKSIINSKEILDPKYFQQLLEEGKDPEKIFKIFKCLAKQEFNNKEKALKAAWLIHALSLKIDLFKYRRQFSEFKLKIENNSKKFNGQDIFLKSYLELIDDKYELLGFLNENFGNFGTNWNFYCFNEFSALVLEYFDYLLRFLLKLLNQKESLSVFSCIAESLTNEILVIYSYFLENIQNLGEKTDHFIESRLNFSSRLQIIYIRYPFIDFQVFLPQNLQFCIHQISVKAKKIEQIFEELKIDPEKITISTDLLGYGATCRVYKANLEQEQVAVKVYTNKFAMKKYSERELIMCTRLKHPNIVNFLGYFYNDSNQLNLVFEYCQGGNLRNLLSKYQLPLTAKLKIALEIATAMLFIHSQSPPILHRDLKLENILISKQIIRTDDEPKAKIADFGFARMEDMNQMTNNIGTIGCMAPEVKSGKFYTTACDVFSFAIVLWEMFVDDQVRKSNIALLNKSDGQRPSVESIKGQFSEELKNLITMCWDENPGNRPDFYDIVSRMESLRDC